VKTLLLSALSTVLFWFVFPGYAMGQKENACVKHIVTPDYPLLARQARLEGIAKVEIDIADDGTVLSAKAASPSEILSRAAEGNIKEWTFYPQRGGGQFKLTIVYQFKLVGKEGDFPTIVAFDLPDRVEITAHPAKLVDAYPSHTQKSPQ
jgi:TonB family protein